MPVGGFRTETGSGVVHRKHRGVASGKHGYRGRLIAMKIEVKKNIMATNASVAAENRERLTEHGICMVNLMASPGAGKTSAIIKAIEGTRELLSLAVIEGDIASE